MKISYDYEELLNELLGDVRAGDLKLTDTIQILRKDAGCGYQAIIDWYEDEEGMTELIEDDEDPLPADIVKQYNEDRPFLQNELVGNVINEMREMNNIL